MSKITTATIAFDVNCLDLQQKIEEVAEKGFEIISVERVSGFRDPNMTGSPNADYLIVTKK